MPAIEMKSKKCVNFIIEDIRLYVKVLFMLKILVKLKDIGLHFIIVKFC